MKRLLAVFLAALMILGASAIGASAAGEPEAPQGGAFDTLTPAQQARLWSLLLDFTSYMDKGQVYNAACLIIALQLAQEAPSALKDPALEAEFNQKVNEALGDVDLAFEDDFKDLIEAFLADDEAMIVAAFKDGTLTGTLRELFNVYLTEFIGKIQPLVTAYVKQDVIDVANSYAKVVNLLWDIQDPNNTEEIKKALKDKLKTLRDEFETKIENYIANGKWNEFKKDTEELINDFKDALNKLTQKWWDKLPKFFRWFLKWVCFGWIWMTDK